MAKIFLDANILVDLVERRKEKTIEDLDKNELFISPLSVHILAYITKQKIPNHKLTESISQFSFVTFDQAIVDKSLDGPTADFEDNVQLHSAAYSECSFFLTEDRELLNMKFFGKTRIIKNLELGYEKIS